MKLLLGLLLFIAAVSQADEHYFTNVREVQLANASQQSYFDVDEEIWNHARADLGDLRLYAGSTEVPYTIKTESATTKSIEIPAEVLELGSTAAGTSFVVKVGQAQEYNLIRLSLETKNFVTQAKVEGMQSVHDSKPVRLGSFSLYDFTRESLGHNFDLKIPKSDFPYLRVTIGNAVRPEQMKGASLAQQEDVKAQYTAINAIPRAEQKQKETVFTWSASEAIPLDRITFETPAVNFLRPVTLYDADGRELASGEISRIRMQRNGQEIKSESLSLNVCCAHSKKFSLHIQNGDDPPLRVAIHPESMTRRIYFDPRGASSLKLYYGDRDLSAPTYEFARLFEEQPVAAPAQLGAGQHNPDFTGRPDTRPWSDRHPAVLWSAMIIAVCALAGVAFSSMKKGAAA